MIAHPEIFFDASLPKLVETMAAELGADALAEGVVVRDASGRLRFISALDAPSDARH